MEACGQMDREAASCAAVEWALRQVLPCCGGKYEFVRTVDRPGRGELFVAHEWDCPLVGVEER